MRDLRANAPVLLRASTGALQARSGIGGAGIFRGMLDSAAVTSPATTRLKSRIGALVAAAIGVFVCLFSHLGAIGMVGPDEPRYAWIARNMAATGDWITPRLYGQPWFEKPILYYWAAASGFRLHLSSEWAARLPSALAALAAALVIGWLAQKYYGDSENPAPNSALLAPLVFATSVGAIGFARSAGPDMLFAASLTLAMAAAAVIFLRAGILSGAADAASPEKRNDALPLALFGVSLGLGVLAKGPAAIVLAGGAVGIWALAARKWRIALRLAHPVAIISFCIVALPWYIACSLRNPEFVRVFIFEHNFQRYLTPVFQHKQPFWFFIPILLLALLPWTALLFPIAQDALRQWREKSWTASPGFFFACWAFFPLLFFSVSQSKLPGYILPAVPPFSLLLAVVLSRAMRFDSRSGLRSGRWIFGPVGATLIVLGAVAIHTASQLPYGATHDVMFVGTHYARFDPRRMIGFCGLLAIAGGVSVTVLGFFRQRAALALSFVTVIALVEIAGLRVLPALDPYISARPHEALLRRDLRPDRLFTFHLQRSWTYGLAFYFGRELPEWSPSDPDPALVLTSRKGFDEIKQLGRFRGVLSEQETGILYVPILPAPR
jgi:4-amino-4-deoxy-L-arabinose transferase-like glycosyltransferase